MSGTAGEEGAAAETGLAAGLVGMLPLLLAYELAQAAGLSWRNSSERMATRALELLGPGEDTGRLVAILVLGGLAAAACVRDGLPLFPLIGRQVVRGGLGAIVLGPLLALSLVLLDYRVAVGASAGGALSGPELVGVVSGAAWEELVFRVGAYGLIFLCARRVGLFAGASESGARWTAEIVGLLGSAALFAAFHLELLSSWLGTGGEEFHAAAFTYRFFAGILLGLLFRWRGPGVAAWSHGLFNLSLALGVAPGSLVG